ncbi:hypothetical protein E2C01_045585 [Portunus trituberculatus]|uniref:Uncharacterized protein n=1 Tax=Portunus trituberculatus TaxID=210409 RepID=A0A5B7G3E1_PORTR|nr:hypothetical protein [Portunus trituberculatus]
MYGLGWEEWARGSGEGQLGGVRECVVFVHAKTGWHIITTRLTTAAALGYLHTMTCFSQQTSLCRLPGMLQMKTSLSVSPLANYHQHSASPAQTNTTTIHPLRAATRPPAHTLASTTLKTPARGCQRTQVSREQEHRRPVSGEDPPTKFRPRVRASPVWPPQSFRSLGEVSGPDRRTSIVPRPHALTTVVCVLR